MPANARSWSRRKKAAFEQDRKPSDCRNWHYFSRKNDISFCRKHDKRANRRAGRRVESETENSSTKGIRGSGPPHGFGGADRGGRGGRIDTVCRAVLLGAPIPATRCRADAKTGAKSPPAPDDRVGPAEGPDDGRSSPGCPAESGDSRSAQEYSRQPFCDLRCESKGPSRQGEFLSVVAANAGRKFRPGRTRRQQDQGRFLHPEARQGAFRIRRPEPDRDYRRRIVAGGTLPQAGAPGHLSAVADAAAVSAVGSHRSLEGHQRRSRDLG